MKSLITHVIRFITIFLLFLLLVVCDGTVSYILSIRIKMAGAEFLIVRFIILLILAYTGTKLWFYISKGERAWLYFLLILLGSYFTFVVRRIYGSDVFDWHKVITDPLATSFLPMMIGIIIAMKLASSKLISPNQ
jgi:hypothetical protein